MVALFVDAVSLNIACQNISYSLTGLPGSWQSSPYFFNLNYGQTYRVRVRDECTGCIYEKDYEIPQDNRINPEDCPCCPKISYSVLAHPINFTGGSGSIRIAFEVNSCCKAPLRIPGLPPLPPELRWTSQTEAMFPISTGFNQYNQTTIDLIFEVRPEYHESTSISPFVSNLVAILCDCEIITVPIFFGR